MNFLKNLNILLHDYRMTRAELARTIGIAPSTINAWYSKGCEGVSLKTLIKISHLFNITIEDLVNGSAGSLYFAEEHYSKNELYAIRCFSDYLKEKRQE